MTSNYFGPSTESNTLSLGLCCSPLTRRRKPESQVGVGVATRNLHEVFSLFLGGLPITIFSHFHTSLNHRWRCHSPSATHSPVRTKFRVSRATAFKASLSSRQSDGPTDLLTGLCWLQTARARPSAFPPSLLFSLIPSALLSSQLKMVAPRSLALSLWHPSR